MEFKDYVRIVLSHWGGVVLLAVRGVVAAFGYNATQPAVYQASATGLLTIGKTTDAGQASVGDTLARHRVTSYVDIATTTQVAPDSRSVRRTDVRGSRRRTATPVSSRAIGPPPP